MKASAYWALGLACVLALLSGACGGGADQAAAGMEADLAALQEQKSALDAKRAELKDLQAQIMAAATDEAAGEEATGEEGEESEVGPSAEELTAQVEGLQGEVSGLSESLMTALVGFLNSANMLEGEEIPAPVVEAIRMKSSEDIVIAEEYVWAGGDCVVGGDDLTVSAVQHGKVAAIDIDRHLREQ